MANPRAAKFPGVSCAWSLPLPSPLTSLLPSSFLPCTPYLLPVKVAIWVSHWRLEQSPSCQHFLTQLQHYFEPSSVHISAMFLNRSLFFWWICQTAFKPVITESWRVNGRPTKWPAWSVLDPHSSTKTRMTRFLTQNLRGSRFYIFCSGEAFSSGQISEKSVTTELVGKGTRCSFPKNPNLISVFGLYLRLFGPCSGCHDFALGLTRLEISAHV